MLLNLDEMFAKRQVDDSWEFGPPFDQEKSSSMSIVFQCECGRTYELDDRSAGRTANCVRCRKEITVPVVGQSATPKTGVQAAPIAPQHRLAPAQDTEGRRDAAGLDSGSDDKGPSIKRGFNLTDLAIVGGGIMMAVAILWYFIGYRLFGGERLAPAGVLFLAGLSFMIGNITRDMLD